MGMLLGSLRQFGGRGAPWYRGSQRLRYSQTGTQAVLVKAVAGPGAAEPGVAPPLDVAEALLCCERRGVVLRMIAHIAAEHQVRIRIGFERWVEADEQRFALVDALKRVHPVGDGDVVFARRGFAATGDFA